MPTGRTEAPATVTGVTLKFTQFGAIRSVAEVAPQPAQIEFIGRFLKSIRKAPDERVQSLGVIQGDIWLEGTPPRARFQCDPASLMALSAAHLSDLTFPHTVRDLPRVLDLFFDTESFIPCPSAAPQLTLPDFAAQYPYLEVLVELKGGGILEAPRGDNSILDVPIWRDSPPRRRPLNCVVSLLLRSNSGNVALANLPYKLQLENGAALEGTTDKDGFLEHLGVPAGDHILVVGSFKSIVGATPPDCVRRLHMMVGYVLISEEIA